MSSIIPSYFARRCDPAVAADLASDYSDDVQVRKNRTKMLEEAKQRIPLRAAEMLTKDDEARVQDTPKA
jgi:hypothetical protein